MRQQRSNATTIDMLILVLAGITTLLFISSYIKNPNLLKLSTQIFAIIYLVGFITFVLLRRKYSIKRKTRTICTPEIQVVEKVIEKPIYVKEKRKITKKYTGSTYKKIYHRRECRFSESIMDKYFEENDDKNYFTKKGYKPCGLCNPNRIKKTNDDNIKEDKK